MAHDISDAVFENKSVYDGSYYAIGYDHAKGKIYLADAGDYQSNGRVLVIDPDTKAAGRFTTGIIPGFFYFAQ